MVGQLRLDVGVRTTAAVAAVVLALILWAPRVGEPDRSEAIAIGRLRAILSAEQAYASANSGLFNTPACLAMPSCASGTDQPVRAFLGPGVDTGLDRGGYYVQFHPGPKAERPTRRDSSTALTRFAVVAIPTDPRASGRRAFCADDRGTVYVEVGGVEPRVEAGRCLDTRSPLR